MTRLIHLLEEVMKNVTPAECVLIRASLLEGKRRVLGQELIKPGLNFFSVIAVYLCT